MQMPKKEEVVGARDGRVAGYARILHDTFETSNWKQVGDHYTDAGNQRSFEVNQAMMIIIIYHVNKTSDHCQVHDSLI